MYSFFSLFTCSTDSISSEALEVQDFTPYLLFIHELWLHPGEPDRPMNLRGDSNVSLKLYGPHYPRTRSPNDVCSWYGNLSDIEIQSLDYPYGLKSRLRMTQSDCPSGIGAQEQAPFQEQGWALSYKMDEGKVALDGDELILQQKSQPNRAHYELGPFPFCMVLL